MKSADNRGIFSGRLQMLYIHVPLVSALSTSYMMYLGINQNKGGIAILETADHMGVVMKLTVEPLNDVVGVDVSPMFAGKVALDQSFLNVIFRLFGTSFSFMALNSSTTALAFSRVDFLLS